MMQKWEYKMERFGMFDNIENRVMRLNELGNQGWELVNFDQQKFIFVFKRKKNSL